MKVKKGQTTRKGGTQSHRTSLLVGWTTTRDSKARICGLPPGHRFFYGLEEKNRQHYGKGGDKMLTKIRKRMTVGGSEGGFTLIELLVVIIIIGILAAIAIPMYLSQRQKGWNANAQSDLRNAAVAQESYFTDNASYTTLVSDLQNNGFNPSANVTLTIISASSTAYCMSARHNSGGDTWYMSSATGEPSTTACT
jgi:type IV pilus assembly protein PilA